MRAAEYVEGRMRRKARLRLCAGSLSILPDSGSTTRIRPATIGGEVHGNGIIPEEGDADTGFRFDHMAVQAIRIVPPIANCLDSSRCQQRLTAQNANNLDASGLADHQLQVDSA